MLRRVVAASIVVQLALGLAVVVSPEAAPGIAWAEPIFEGLAVIDLLQPTGIVADGATPVDLYILALTPDGGPIAGLKGKPTASAGATTDIVDIGGGLYKFSFTPAKSDTKQVITLQFKSKLPTKEPVARTWTVNVAPPTSYQLAVALNPSTITLGMDKTANMALTLSGGDRDALASADLRAFVSSGRVQNVTSLGGGQFSALYTPPSVVYPHLLLVTTADQRNPAQTYGHAVVPLVGKIDFGVQVAPNSLVIIKVGGREFGPIQSNAQGLASVPIVVPPGAEGATKVQIAPDKKVTEEPLDLLVPETRRLALFPIAAAVPADARFAVPVRTLVVTPAGKPDENALVTITSTAGTVSPALHEGGGVYVATFTPPTSNANTQVTLTVNLSNGTSIQTDSTTLNLVPVRPAKVVLSSEPAILSSTADGFRVFAKVTAPDGQGLGNRAVSFSVNGGKLKEVKDLRNGDYQASFSTTGSGPVELSASVGTASTGNPFSRVLLIPAKDRIANDGLSPLLFTVATVDQYGYPVGNMAVNLRLLSGDGTIPAVTTTGANGTAQVYYTPGRKPQTVSVEATAGDATAAVTVIQAPASLALPDVPTVAPKAIAAMVDEWSAAISPFRIEREGMTGAVLAPTVLQAEAGTQPSKLAVTVDPATVSPGGSVVLKLQLQTAEGRGVGGAQVIFLTSAGTVGALIDLGNGNYQAPLFVPAGTTGDVNVSVATKDGLLSQFIRIPLAGAGTPVGQSFTTAPDPYATQASVEAAVPTPTAPVSTTKVKPERDPPETGEFPWLRVRGGYTIAAYNYDQQPLGQSTALFPDPVQLEAMSQGFGLNARVWVPGVPYLGAEVQGKSTRYSLDPTALCAALGRPCADVGNVGDWVTDIRALGVGRYPFAAGKSQFWVGARVGYDTSDVQAIQASATSVDLTQKWIHSMAVGAELGANVGERVFFHTDFTEYLAGVTTPWCTTFNVEGGVAFLPNMYASVAYDLSIRKIDVLDDTDQKIGEVSDVEGVTGGNLPVGFTLSLGAQF